MLTKESRKGVQERREEKRREESNSCIRREAVIDGPSIIQLIILERDKYTM